MPKTGSQHAQSLNDGREAFINGERVVNVCEHPAFRRTARTICGLFDFAARPENADLMTFAHPDANATEGQSDLATSAQL